MVFAFPARVRKVALCRRLGSVRFGVRCVLLRLQRPSGAGESNLGCKTIVRRAGVSLPHDPGMTKCPYMYVIPMLEDQIHK